MSDTTTSGAKEPLSEPLLALKGYSKSFGPVDAMKEVSIEVRPGEVMGLLGDNGAGKSTLVKAIAGVQPADSGEAEFEGKPVSLNSPQAATGLGIATVYQDLALCENLDIVANLFLGQEETDTAARILDETDMEQKTEELLGSLGVTTIRSVRTEVERLSGGQRQAIAIARSLLGDPKMVLLDEPTAALGVVQTAHILDLIKRLRDRGLGVIVISHNLADVFEVADRVTVLRLGRVAGTYKLAETTEEQVVAAITGRRRRARDGGDAAMTTEATTADEHSELEEVKERFAPGAMLRRLARGDLAELRVIFGIAVIWTIFQIANDRFLSAINLSNLTLQIAAVATISIGVVLVLLLGEIDLSVGAVSGLAAAVMAVESVKHGVSPTLAIVLGLGVGLLVGLFNGFMVTTFGIPSFVVTLAGLLGWQGAQLWVLGDTGSVNLPDSIITDLTSTFFSDGVGWILGIVAIAGLRRERCSGTGAGACRPASRPTRSSCSA